MRKLIDFDVSDEKGSYCDYDLGIGVRALLQRELLLCGRGCYVGVIREVELYKADFKFSLNGLGLDS